MTEEDKVLLQRFAAHAKDMATAAEAASKLLVLLTLGIIKMDDDVRKHLHQTLDSWDATDAAHKAHMDANKDGQT